MRERAGTLLVALLAAAAAGAAGACGERPDAWEQSRVVTGPIPMKDRIAYVDGARDAVVVVDAGAGGPRVDHYTVGHRPIFAAPTPDGQKLLVVTRGREALYEGEIDEAPGLYVLAVAAPEAPPIRYELESPFDRIAVAESGARAVAYFSAAGPDAEGLFWNPNELAVIDLASPPAPENPVFRTIRSFSSAPTGVVLAPEMGVPGAPAERAAPRTFAFVFAPNTLTILDASNPGRREVSIRLATAGQATVSPEEIVFAPQAGAAYLRARGARDVLSIQLSYQAPAADSPNDNDYRPTLAELGAGGTPADIAVYDDVGGTRRVVAATPGTREVTLIDTTNGGFVSVPTPDPIDRILLLPDDAPRVAVLASLSTRAARGHLLGLDRIGDDLAPINLETVGLAEPTFDVVPVPGHEQVMVVHDDARTVLGMLDVRNATVAPLEGAGRLDAYDFAGGGAYLVGATRGVPRVGVVDLANLHPTDVRLDDDPAYVFALASGGIYVDHGDPFGRATLIPQAGAGRDQAVVLSGFLVAGLFDERF